MTENDLFTQLKSLKKINPSATWLKSNREILLSQIANSSVKELSPWKKLVIDVNSIFSIISQPALALGSLLLLLVGMSAFGHLAFNRMKPNDSLYIARIISEKAKLTTVFNTEAREKMEAQFATNHAEAITEVLARADVNDEVQVAKLNDSFNKELATVRTKVAKKNVVESDLVPMATSTEEDDILLTAGNSKDEAGLQLTLSEDLDLVATSTEEVVTKDVATSSEEVKSEEVAEVAEVELKAPEEILLDEAQSLFDNKEYSGALDKLKEVQELIK